ncbi:MAG: beta-galactosidase [Lachnospiraceae bacterium]|nr:beta-galactosidase [Lachnospiraceae bacterium]
MNNELELRNLKRKEIFPLGASFQGRNFTGDEISFTNFYMQKDGNPFFGISGEFHYSRMSETRWEDELVKMKMCGINVVATYVFWIHHEEKEGIFRFDGCRDLRRFVCLCEKYGLYVIMRVGPFDHGEVRNGGIPDWMYGKPFEVRSLNDDFLYYVKRLYAAISDQVQGLFFKDGGPIIGVQIDNEYMHSSAPWEFTTGISDEWVFGGNEGEAYMLRLKDLAAECGLNPVFYTCTGWGGAPTPESMLPLWGGYAFRPWIFYSYSGEHPATEEYIYKDYHNNSYNDCTGDFKPGYEPESRPYACCEMGGGMTCSYYYRFQYPYKSVDAMANIKIASGCNFLGYYMFQGGSNPLGMHGQFMNEGQTPRISYDYQAPLGEFGQVRESYRRLKSIHYFVSTFGERLCDLRTVLPETASDITPMDETILRYAVRTDGKRGFLFLNNYQDHHTLPSRSEEKIILHLEQEDLEWEVGIESDENAILPFHFDMDGIELVKANVQLITKTERNGEILYICFIPDGMEGELIFEKNAVIKETSNCRYSCAKDRAIELFHVEKGTAVCSVLVISREMANDMYLLSDGSVIFTKGIILEKKDGICLESGEADNIIYTWPADRFEKSDHIIRIKGQSKISGGVELGTYRVKTAEWSMDPIVKQVGPSRYTVQISGDIPKEVKDVMLQIEYIGNIGNAFLNDRMISDNFSNGAVWEIGLNDFISELKENRITIYIVPLKEGANVNVESAMAARMEEVRNYIAELKSVKIQPVYVHNL